MTIKVWVDSCNYYSNARWNTRKWLLIILSATRTKCDLICCHGDFYCFKTQTCFHENPWPDTCTCGLTRGPWTLLLCMIAAVGMTLAVFCRLVLKTRCCKLNHLKSRLTLTQYLTGSWSQFPQKSQAWNWTSACVDNWHKRLTVVPLF